MIQMVNLEPLLRGYGQTNLQRGFSGKQNYWSRHRAVADRYLDWVFDGESQVGLNDALLRFLCYWTQQDPAVIGEILEWACNENIAEFDEGLEQPLWRRIHHGVTFVPRWPHDLDTRVKAPSGGAHSRAALGSREQKRRNREKSEFKAEAADFIRRGLRTLDCNLEVPSFFVAPDLPPSQNLSQLEADIPTFLSGMPTWRVIELYWYLRQLLEEQPVMSMSPPELDDFELPSR